MPEGIDDIHGGVQGSNGHEAVKTFNTRVPGFRIRFAQEGDESLILRFIRHLAEYERLAPEVVATEDILHESLFIRRRAEVILGELDGEPVAFALFFHNFSTFLGRANMYLEDLFVEERCRGQGLGRCMFACLAVIAVQRGCRRLDWWCLDWNEPAMEFYARMGAKAMSDWTVHRLEGPALVALSRTL